MVVSPVSVRLDASRSWFLMSCEPAHQEVLRDLRAREDWESRLWWLSATPRDAARLDMAFGGNISFAFPEERALFEALVDRHRAERPVLGEAEHDHSWAFKFPPFQCQKEGVTRALRDLNKAKDYQKAILLAMWMGTGKTALVIALTAILRLWSLLVICPLKAMEVWAEQFRIHALQPWDVVLLDDSLNIQKKTRLFSQAHAGACLKHPTAIVLNFDSFWREPLRSALLANKFPLLVYDEIHKLKSPQGKASQFAFHLSQRAERRIGMTGTPISTPRDLFGQGRALDPTYFGLNITAFDHHYCVRHPHLPHVVVGYKNIDELSEKFNLLAYQVGKDALGLPPEQHNKLYGYLTGDAERAQLELEEELITQVGDDEFTAASALVLFTRLRQLTSGFLKNTAGEEIEIHKTKEKMLRDYLDDLPPKEPVVVFCIFQRDIETIRRVATEAGRTVLEVSGARNEWQRFQNDGEGDLIVVQIQAGSIAINLVRAHYGAFYSLNFSLIDYEQAKARILRKGQKYPVVFHHFLIRNSIDERTYQLLDQRQDMVQALMSAYRRNRRAA